MPTYDYICTACDNAWEQEQRISEPAADTCPKCGQKTAKRQVSGGAGFILKGGGWYADLYSSSKKPSGSASHASSSGSSGDASSSGSSGSTSESSSKPASTETKSTTGSTAPKTGSTGT